MPYSTTGLPNNGRTQFFNFQYDDSLTAARGRDLAAAMMTTCDADLAILAAWFSGRQLDMSPPINVSINSVAVDSGGNPTQFIGGHWMGALLVPLQVTINIGELPMAIGTPVMLARYLLICEVSEMYMRAFGPYTGPNPWFRFGEGNKGEGLSRFLATQFLLRTYPGIMALPMLAISNGFWNCTNFWLNSVRDNLLEINDEDIQPDPETGCATLFLFYLHDQLGYSIEDIINNGGGHLSNIYENLTHDSWTNAWPNFGGLVNSHYPNTAAGGGFTPSFFPPLETLFPVAELTVFAAPTLATWVSSGSSGSVTVAVDRPALAPLAISVTSSHPAIIPDMSLTVTAGMTSTFRTLKVQLQGAAFAATTVTLTARYAGRTLTRDVTVISPTAISFDPLEIDVDRSADPCAAALVEGTPQTFVITNLNVFPDQSGLTFAWTVTGATPASATAANLTIPTLPAAGTTVTIQVTVTNRQGLNAKGTYTFQSLAVPSGVRALESELRCRLNRFRNGSLSIPPWVPVERAGQVQERLVSLQKQVNAASHSVAAMNGLIKKIQELSRQHEVAG